MVVRLDKKHLWGYNIQGNDTKTGDTTIYCGVFAEIKQDRALCGYRVDVPGALPHFLEAYIRKLLHSRIEPENNGRCRL